MKNWITQTSRLALRSFRHLTQPMSLRFAKDERGNFAMIMALVLVPLLLAGMVAVDSANLMRVRNNVQASLDAAALAVGRRFSTGESQTVVQVYGAQVFTANLTALSADAVNFDVAFPKDKTTDQQIQATAGFTYKSLFGVIASRLTGDDWDQNQYTLSSSVRLKNTIEVALVLDNSRSMDETRSGSTKKRIDLLKEAASQLVETMAAQSTLITHVENPVQFSLVPFAGSVNVGPQYLNAAWMDPEGRSPVNLENFTLPVTIDSTRKIEEKPVGSGRYYKSGTGWGERNNKPYSRAELYADLSLRSKETWLPWQGCVESRPGTYALDVTPPSDNNPDTLFVPMFGPAEYYNTDSRGNVTSTVLNSWWQDDTSLAYSPRQSDLKKYYLRDSLDKIYRGGRSNGGGPNYSCTSSPLTPLTDVTTEQGMKTIQTAITAMVPSGGTNVPEAMAWGWRTIVRGAPFTEARPSTERGNDKVVIVLTDGANTYYKYDGLAGSGPDRAANFSYYSAHGYTARITKHYSQARLFQESGVSVSQNNSTYTKAMNARFAKLCDNAKSANIIVMTVALDLSETNSTEKAQIDLLRSCSSNSRVRMESGRPAKLFWNSTGGELSETFRQIGDELSNLRIVD